MISQTAPAPSPADADDQTSAPSECVGPLAIPSELMRALAGHAAACGADDLAALMICATVLVRRLSRRDSAMCGRVIFGEREAVTPLPDADGPLDVSVDFHTALRQAGRFRASDPAAAHRIDVTILVSQHGERLFAESMTDSADAPVAPCWARAFLHLLTCLADRPAAPMTAHPLFDEAERDRIVHGLNPYERPQIRHRTLAGPFEERAALTPQAVALLDERGAAVSYGELNELGNRLAHFLRAAGAATGTRIGICMKRGIGQVIAIHAAAKTGAAYVPIDDELPDARLEYILADSAPLHILTDAACRARIPEGPWQTYDIEADRDLWEACPATNLTVDGPAGAALHILYTSGTTGLPKGVVYPTDAALANIQWMQRHYPYRPGDTALLKTSPGFDVHIWEVFWPLYHGARLVILEPGGHRDPARLARVVEDHGVTAIFLVPTVMTPLLEHISARRARRLRWALCGGEPMSPRVRDLFHATLPGCALINAFGPTEAGPVTDNVIPPGSRGSNVPVGRPAANFRIYVLDEDLHLVPVGMPGEAYIAGEIALAHGYWRAPGRTAERFVADPYGPPGSRMYRTGDLCRYRDDGRLEHLGRIDRQIKIRGLRVEPGEIESVLGSHPAVSDCAVIAHGDPVRLLAFAVPVGRVSFADGEVAQILEHAAKLLPEHMRPEQVIPVERIPATLNGKVDRDTLIGLWHVRDEGRRDIVPPADELETALVEIYRQVLENDRVSVLDTFVQLGGHSLLAFRLLDECTKRLDVTPDVTDLITGTVRDVAASIRAGRAGD